MVQTQCIIGHNRNSLEHNIINSPKRRIINCKGIDNNVAVLYRRPTG